MNRKLQSILSKLNKQSELIDKEIDEQEAVIRRIEDVLIKQQTRLSLLKDRQQANQELIYTLNELDRE